MAIFPKLIYKVNEIPVLITIDFIFVESDKLILNDMELQETSE